MDEKAEMTINIFEFWQALEQLDIIALHMRRRYARRMPNQVNVTENRLEPVNAFFENVHKLGQYSTSTNLQHAGPNECSNLL